MSEGKRVKQEGDITGVSRSGRVRKKSSKLMDFESPDDLDTRFKQRIPSGTTPVSGIGRGRKSNVSMERTPDSMFKSPSSDTDEMEFERVERDPLSDSGSDSDPGAFPTPDSALDDSSLDSEESEDDLDQDFPSPEATVAQGAAPDREHATSESRGESGTQAQSLYMLEKSTKKRLVIRDGKIVGRMKAQRKDKGQTRFTAYMLWAKEVRIELLRANPDLDFATMSKRLGELWATVPNNEKYNWKRRAKRMAVKGHRGPDAATALTELKKAKPASRSKFINMNKGGKTAATTNKSTRVLQLGVPSMVGGIPISPPDPRSGKGLGGGIVADPVVGPGMYKVVGSQPVDVAAHLKLLGESLTIIGERLQEHEGQIAVSGSLSVLLDSLLCALGPLVCLSQQVPETDGCPPELLTKILDNIAYFMPGL